jgi:beta-lactamase family protein
MSVIALLMAAAVPAVAGRLQFHFVGNMAFHVTDGRTVLVTDFPYRSGYSGYMTWRAQDVPDATGGLALVTHGHPDHFEAPLFERTDLTLIAPPDVLRRVSAARTIAFAPRMNFRDIEVQAQETPHAGIGHCSYLVTWHGRRLYFTGDTESTEQLLQARGLDVAFVSPWLLRSVARQGARLDAAMVVVYHQEAGEAVPDLLGRRVFRQGEGFFLDFAPTPRR